MLKIHTAFIFTTLTACLTADVKLDIDEDNDGLTLLEEETHGTDPQNPDSDGDGQTDGEEIEAGTDPLVPPKYLGGYLVNPCSSASDGIEEGYSVGQKSPDWTLVDQHGEDVTLSDFCGSVVLLETSAFW